MDTSSWFENLPVIGNLPPEQAAGKLREVGEEEAATLLEQAEGAPGQTFRLGERKGFWPFQDKPWQYTAHTFGYLASAASGNETIISNGCLITTSSLASAVTKGIIASKETSLWSNFWI
jgi:hypothetical protein